MTDTSPYRNLASGFVEAFRRFPSRPALIVERQSYSYQQLAGSVGALASALRENDSSQSRLVAILSSRNHIAYTGILGTLVAGRGYVPLNPSFPAARNRDMLLASGADAVIVDPQCLPLLEEMLAGLDAPLLLVFLEPPSDLTPTFACPSHRAVVAHPVCGTGDLDSIPACSLEDIAYLMFTSGSTGRPKGIAVTHRNATAYVDYVCDRYDVTEEDRFSQVFALTFDLSVHDMFVCWERGACLCVVPDKSVMAPARFVREHRLSMWFSVPSTAATMQRLGMLKEGTFPSLRWSLFCGEPLAASHAAAWQRAAPGSMLENLYGPTEATIAITHYRWDGERSPVESRNGIVPIGTPFTGQTACVIDDQRHTVPSGSCGELCLSGSQVTKGYWNNVIKTREQFVRLPERNGQIWYRTGDLVTADETGCLHYLSRLDHQVKVRGYRVELQEVDRAVRQATGCDEVVSVAWPKRDGIADGIVTFVRTSVELDVRSILAVCRNTLPDYMLPRRIQRVDEMPLNANGKTDRSKLIGLLNGN